MGTATMSAAAEIIVVVGARPQFIKASALCAAFIAVGLPFRLLHTGQHFDEAMSGVFFRELNLPPPAWNLACGGTTHGAMTGAMLAGIEEVLLREKPGMVVVFGDTNSTLAGALAAAKLHIPVAHVEAGLRSHNRRMPEELNRICTDHLSDLLFCSSDAGRDLLAAEGITRGVHVSGDVMADVFFSTLARVRAGGPRERFHALLTLHRAENTDDPDRLRSILAALEQSGVPVVFPVHPRTRKALETQALPLPANVRCVEPTGHTEFVALLDACAVLLTDSGGLQKEALWAGKPCITLRDETEWTETVATGWNTVAGAETAAILAALKRPVPAGRPPALYGDGQSAPRIAAVITGFMDHAS